MNKLDREFILGKIRIRNRLVLPPLTTGYGTDTGGVTPEILRFYKSRSRQMGTVIVEAAAVSPDGRIVPGSLGLWDDGQIGGMAELAETIRAEGAMAVIQINHAGAKAWTFEPGTTGISPSGISCRPGILPVRAGAEDMERLVRDFAKAAKRAKAAGFDGVEIHGAHLYLLSQFISPLTNLRTDEYGGGIRERAALSLKVVRAVRKCLGPDYPVFFRLNVMENMEGGASPDDALVLGTLLAEAGVDVLVLSLAVSGTWKTEGDIKVLITTSAYAKDQAAGGVAGLAGRFRETCGLPVIAVGCLGSRKAAEAALVDGADFAAVGRQMICDPGTAEKILSGSDDQILRCESCMACFACLGKGRPVKCKVNPHLPD